MAKWAEKLTRLLDRGERALFPRERGVDRGRLARSPFAEPIFRARLQGLQRALVALISVAFVVSFSYAVYFYSTTRARIETHPLVTNLTKQGLTGRVQFGTSERCGDAGQECWLLPKYDDRTWLSIRVPLLNSNPVHTLPGFAEAPAGSHVYYRIPVEIPQALLAQDDVIAFTPTYVTHKAFEAYINGRLVYASGGTKITTATTIIPIPRSDIKNGRVLIAIKATLDKDLSGLTNRAAAYVGPKPVLDELYVHAERAGSTYHLLFLLSKGGIFVVFTFFFIFSKGPRGLFSFLAFAFFSTIENLFFGSFLNEHVNYFVLDAGVILSKVAATNAMLSFLADFFQIHRKGRLVRRASLASIGLAALMVFDYGWGSRSVAINDLLNVTNAYVILVVLCGFGGGVVTRRMWIREGINQAARRNLDNLLAFIAVYFGLLIWEVGFNKYYGFDKRALFDLLLFYYMAFVTARDFGHKEGQVRTLEGHMIEKRRMEVELREAAEIARLFLPGSVPLWPKLAISTYHQPLTENSGDWYAFEAARKRRLYHFLLCDITGHGAQAALVVSSCKTVLSLLVRNSPEALEDPYFIARYAHELNALLHMQGEGQHAVTFLGLTFDLGNGVVHYASGGNPPPLLVRRLDSGGVQVSALVTRNTLLGVLPSVQIMTKTDTLVPGDVLIAHTDGLPAGAHMKALREAIASSSLSTTEDVRCLYEKVWDAHVARSASAPKDDVSIACFTFDAADVAKKTG